MSMATAKPAPSDALSALDNTRIKEIRPLLPPQILTEEIALTDSAAQVVLQAREEISAILKGDDKRLLVVVGPCSIHDTKAALEYAARLKELVPSLKDELCIVMRAYFEKPRTTVGWKGLINDPNLDGTFKINKGLRIARQLLMDINGQVELPCAGECLDTISPQFLADLFSWSAIGARTTQSQVHRELASGLSMPVGFKNDTDGNVKVAIDAILAASREHHFLSVTKQGLSAIVATAGNDCCHVILRGGNKGPNYDEASVKSEKDYRRQRLVIQEICRQLMHTQSGAYISGVMIESNLVEGRQDLPNNGGIEGLAYGQSITDACVSFEETKELLQQLHDAAAKRRRQLV
ncbi:hypothetical protein RI367_002186 [Sorochytrium milnesiophthora]